MLSTSRLGYARGTRDDNKQLTAHMREAHDPCDEGRMLRRQACWMSIDEAERRTWFLLSGSLNGLPADWQDNSSYSDALSCVATVFAGTKWHQRAVPISGVLLSPLLRRRNGGRSAWWQTGAVSYMKWSGHHGRLLKKDWVQGRLREAP
jgi:hypothetical protein